MDSEERSEKNEHRARRFSSASRGRRRASLTQSLSTTLTPRGRASARLSKRGARKSRGDRSVRSTLEEPASPGGKQRGSTHKK